MTRAEGTALVALARSEGESQVARSFVNGIETVGGDHVAAALASAPRACTMVVSVWVKRPRFERVDRGYVVHNKAARDLVTAAMAVPETKAS